MRDIYDMFCIYYTEKYSKIWFNVTTLCAFKAENNNFSSVL